MVQIRATQQVKDQLNAAVAADKASRAAGGTDSSALKNLVNQTYGVGYLNFAEIESARNYLMGLAGAPGSKASDDALKTFDAVQAGSPSGLAHTARLAGTATPEQMPYIKSAVPTQSSPPTLASPTTPAQQAAQIPAGKTVKNEERFAAGTRVTFNDGSQITYSNAEWDAFKSGGATTNQTGPGPVGPSSTPLKYFQFKGSPDVFDQNGNYISAAQAGTLGGVGKLGVQQLDYVRPEVKTSADFSKYSGKSVPVSAFTSGSPIPKGSDTPGTTNYDGIRAGATASLPEQVTLDATEKLIQETIAQLGQQEKDQQNAEQTTGVTQLKAQLNDLQAQLKDLNAQTAASQANVEGRPIGMGAIVGEQGEFARQGAIKALGLTASINALQGNLQTAQDQANRMVDLKYTPLRAKLEQLNQLLQYNYNSLSKAEQRQADALKLQNDIQLKQLDTQADEDKKYETYFITALANSAPLATVNQARTLYASGNKDAALSLLAKYIGTKNYETTPGSGNSASERRDATTSAYLQSAKGTDGYVSASGYQEALRKFIAGGGTQSNFLASFSPQTYLRQQEMAKLPASLQPQTLVSKGDLTPEQTSIINDAKAAIDQVKQRYGDWGATRQQIIDQSKQQYNFDISPYI